MPRRPFSDSLAFTGDVEKDFTTGADLKPRKGVIKINDATLTGGQTPVDSPDVGLPPGPAWSGRLSGWDIKNMYFQLDFDTGALHFGINCFGVCGDADGDGDANAASMVLQQAGGNDNPDFALSESFAVGLDLGGSGAVLKGDGKMDFVIGYPAQLGDQSDRFPCGDRFDITCFGVYFFQAGASTSPARVSSTRRTRTTASRRACSPSCRRASSTATRSRRSAPDLEWTINDFNGFRTDAGFDAVDLNAVIPWEMNLVGFAGSFQDDGIGEDFLPNNAPFVTVPLPVPGV
jgi:hypothetical protein